MFDSITMIDYASPNRAAVSIWNGKDTLSRYGRDDFGNTYATAKDAMKAAETIYRETLS